MLYTERLSSSQYTITLWVANGYLNVAPKTVTPKQVNDFQKALNWFRKNNVEAYYGVA